MFPDSGIDFGYLEIQYLSKIWGKHTLEAQRFFHQKPTRKDRRKSGSKSKAFHKEPADLGLGGPHPKPNMTIAGKSTMNESIRISHFMAGDFPAIVMLVFGSVTDFPAFFFVFGQKISIWLA